MTRALTARELDVLANAARGLPAKLVGYALGLSPSQVSASLERAAHEIGLLRRADAVRIAAVLTRDPRARLVDADLTRSEQEVLDLLVRGLSNREIALMRGRSIRTIANQVARLLRKKRVPSRRALIALTP